MKTARTDIIMIFSIKNSVVNIGMMTNWESSNQLIEKGMTYKDQSLLSLVSPEHLERLVQICLDDGMAVLEYKDTGLVIIAEKQAEKFSFGS